MTDPFALFGIAPSFELDAEALALRHKELSLSAHPDRLRADRAERRSALSRSIDLNQAYRLLKDPVTRAEALLKLSGREELLEVKVSEAFLFEVLELREELSDASSAKSRAKVENLLAIVSERRAKVETRVGELFSRLGAETEPLSLNELGRELSSLRYLRRFEEEAKNILDEL